MKNYLHLIRRFIYIALGTIDNMFGRTNPRVILCYHSVERDGWIFSVTLESLEAHMRYMLSHYTPVRLADITKNSKNTFAITFDDGYKNIYSTKKMFKKLGIRPTVFAISDTKQVNRKVLEANLPLLSSVQLQKLKKSGWDIGSHSKTHELLDTLDTKSLREQLYPTTKSFSYPKGRYSKRVVAAVKRAGYKIGVSMDDRLIDEKSDMLTLPRIGVNNTHSLSEFAVLASPSVVAFRANAKSIARLFRI